MLADAAANASKAASFSWPVMANTRPLDPNATLIKCPADKIVSEVKAAEYSFPNPM